MKAVNFGSMNLDYFYRVDHFVRPGETLSVSSFEIRPGGKGLNQSIALARAGIPVYHAGTYGTGGEVLKQTLEENGVNTDFLERVSCPQGNALIQVDRTGENSILLFGGSNEQISDEQIERVMAALEKGDYLLLQNEISSLAKIVDEAYRKGVKIILNASPCNEKLKDIDFGKLSWISVNELEVKDITGSEIPIEAWRILHEQYPQLNVLITLGPAGSVAFTKEETVTQAAFAVDAIDTTGAGDTYTGYFFGGLIEGRSLSDCMQRASMASAIAVTKAGAAASVPYKDEVEEKLEYLFTDIL